MKSNGWDDETAALQLFAHLEGDVLNIALLLLDDQRATRSGLSEALSEYYNFPGRLANYRQKFENVFRRDEQNLSVFVMELEILAARGFGEASHHARARMVRDRFVSGHRDCERATPIHKLDITDWLFGAVLGYRGDVETTDINGGELGVK